jgi:hypothetical protein
LGGGRAGTVACDRVQIHLADSKLADFEDRQRNRQNT